MRTCWAWRACEAALRSADLTPASRRRWLAPAAVAAVWAVAVAGLGAQATELGAWYAALKQPAWKPPDLWFGPAWTLIFTLTAVAGVRAWVAAQAVAPRRALLGAFGLNSVLNVGWSWLFFKMQRPDWAMVEWALLWLSIVVLLVLCRRDDRWAGMLLWPYLLWVTFAGALNLAVVRLNAPFG